MTRTAESRTRLMENDSDLAEWIAEMLTRLPLEEARPEWTEYRFADTVAIPRARVRRAASEPWFDRDPLPCSPHPEPTPAQPVRIVYPAPLPPITRHLWRRRVANACLAMWWKATGRGTSHVAWSMD